MLGTKQPNSRAVPAYPRSDTSRKLHGISRSANSNSKLSQTYRLGIACSFDVPDVADAGDVDWDSVRFVDIMVDSPPTCAICLDHVSVPHTLECGHIFCLPCILLHLTSACNCCVCSVYARPGHLRSVRVQFTSSVESGSSRTFQIVRMDGGIALPLGDQSSAPPTQSTPGWWFSRIVRVQDVEVQRLHRSELLRLADHSIASFGPEDDFHAFGVSQAIEFMTSRISSLDEPSVASPSNRAADPNEVLVSIDISSLQSLPRGQYRSGQVYIYQLVDGQHVYLEPVWMRVLLLHYAGEADGFDKIDRLTPSLSLPIVFKTSFTMDAENRRRYRALAHLPFGTPVTLCDVDLRGIVSVEALEELSGPVSRRLQAIKKAKLQQRIDRRDVARAKAVPLIAEWSVAQRMSHLLAQPEQLPSDSDFVPLTGSAAPEREDGILIHSYADVAADLVSPPRQPSAEIMRALDRAVEKPRSKKGGIKFRIAG
jgi:hypothetical protein